MTATLSVRFVGRTDGLDLRPVVELIRGLDLRPGESRAWTIAGWGSMARCYTAADLLAVLPRNLVESSLADPEFVGVVVTRTQPALEGATL